jgi:hypothetical protein
VLVTPTPKPLGHHFDKRFTISRPKRGRGRERERERGRGRRRKTLDVDVDVDVDVNVNVNVNVDVDVRGRGRERPNGRETTTTKATATMPADISDWTRRCSCVSCCQMAKRRCPMRVPRNREPFVSMTAPRLVTGSTARQFADGTLSSPHVARPPTYSGIARAVCSTDVKASVDNATRGLLPSSAAREYPLILIGVFGITEADRRAGCPGTRRFELRSYAPSLESRSASRHGPAAHRARLGARFLPLGNRSTRNERGSEPGAPLRRTL